MPIVAPESRENLQEVSLRQPPCVNPWISALATQPAARAVDFAPWIPQVLRLARQEQLEEAVDLLFENVDSWLCHSKFQACNRLLELPAKVFPLKLAVSLLALTRPAAAHLPARSAFLNGVVQMIEKEGRNSEDVLGRLLH